MIKLSFSDTSGQPIAKVVGGEHDNKIIYITDSTNKENEKCCKRCKGKCEIGGRMCCRKCTSMCLNKDDDILDKQRKLNDMILEELFGVKGGKINDKEFEFEKSKIQPIPNPVSRECV